MNVGTVASGGGLSYVAMTPYLNGVQRTSDELAAEQLKIAAANADATVTGRASASSIVAATPPFLNPAIWDIAARAALAPVLAVSPAPHSVSPTDFVLYGDSGLLIQSYGAIALFAGPLAIAPVYHRSPAPAIAAVPPLAPFPRIDTTA